MIDISVSVSCEELKLAQVTNFNNLFQLLKLILVKDDTFSVQIFMLVHQNVNIMASTKTRLLILIDYY